MNHGDQVRTILHDSNLNLNHNLIRFLVREVQDLTIDPALAFLFTYERLTNSTLIDKSTCLSIADLPIITTSYGFSLLVNNLKDNSRPYNPSWDQILLSLNTLLFNFFSSN